MNKNILKKVLDELKQEQPKLDYIRGMLETLFEIEGGKVIQEPDLSKMFPATGTNYPPYIYQKVDASNMDEGTMLNNKAQANLNTIKDIANKSITME